MDSTNRILKFHIYGLKKTALGFWSVMLIINILSYVLTMYYFPRVRVGLFSGNDDTISLAGINIMPIFIFFIVYGILLYHEDFALALSFGATRKDYYKSTIISNILVVLIFAVIQSIIQIVDKHLVASLGFNPMTEFGIFNTSTDSILYIILVFSSIFLTLNSVTNLLGVFQYRFGYKFWVGLGILVLVGQMFFGNLILKLILGFREIYLYLLPRFKSSTIFITGGFVTIISYTLGYFLLRKANIKK
ncbi:MAG: hypothetical protein GX300_09470 [Tissierellia bacterium]|nr:hypothetical protein [Tissierellia bacterium]